MWVYVCVYAHPHPHPHCTHIEYSVVSPVVGMRHLEGQKNPDGLHLGICVFVYVYKVYTCMYMLDRRRDDILD